MVPSPLLDSRSFQALPCHAVTAINISDPLRTSAGELQALVMIPQSLDADAAHCGASGCVSVTNSLSVYTLCHPLSPLSIESGSHSAAVLADLQSNIPACAATDNPARATTVCGLAATCDGTSGECPTSKPKGGSGGVVCRCVDSIYRAACVAQCC